MSTQVAESPRTAALQSRLAGVAAAVCGAALAGGASAIAGSTIRLWFVVLAVALLPVVTVMTTVSPALSAGFLTFAQPFEAFEFATPIATLSIGSLALLVFLLIQWRQVMDVTRRSLAMRVLLAVAGIFVLAHGAQFLHTDVSSASRQLVTVASFVAFWLVGASVGWHANGRRGLAAGSLAALLLLGVVGILVSAKILPAPARVSEPRAMLGFTSPFNRNYGLDVGYASTALLLPLCLPWLSLKIMTANDLPSRVFAVLGFSALAFVVILVFQSRSMIAELGIAITSTIVLLRTPAALKALTIAIVVTSAVYLMPSIMRADPISTDLRTESYSYAVEKIRAEPKILLIGTNRSEFAKDLEASTRYGSLVPGSPVHNAFIDETLTAGLLGATALIILTLAPAVKGWRCLRSHETREMGVLAVGSLAILLFEIFVNPTEANVAGLWLTLGSVASMGFVNVHRAEDGEYLPRDPL